MSDLKVKGEIRDPQKVISPRKSRVYSEWEKLWIEEKKLWTWAAIGKYLKKNATKNIATFSL